MRLHCWLRLRAHGPPTDIVGLFAQNTNVYATCGRCGRRYLWMTRAKGTH